MGIKETTHSDLCSTEAEYVATTIVACQVVWMRKILNELLHEKNGANKIVCDNKSSITLSNNHIFHK
jgi:hypothetical protein